MSWAFNLCAVRADVAEDVEAVALVDNLMRPSLMIG